MRSISVWARATKSSRERIGSILHEMATSDGLDARFVRLLLDNVEDVRCSIKERQDQAWEYYQSRFGVSGL